MVDEEGDDSKAQDKCALCGKPLVKAKVRQVESKEVNFMVVDEIIDGSHYLFDTKDCATIFKKFGGVYGSNFYEDICKTS
jgi:hypothetical protein